MIYQNSRYTKATTMAEDSYVTFKMRGRYKISERNAKVHQFVLGDRLDGLALHYYGNPQLWWVILEANPQYRCELDISYGDNLVIPDMREVERCLR